MIYVAFSITKLEIIANKTKKRQRIFRYRSINAYECIICKQCFGTGNL